MKHVPIAVILGIFVLAACANPSTTDVDATTQAAVASTQAAQPSNTAAPTNSPIPTASPVPTDTPEATLTKSPTPTNTKEPSNTPTPSPSPVPTDTSTPMPTSSATPVGPAADGLRVRSADGMEMVYVPAGEFLMGSPDGVGDDDEHPQHTVYLDAFWIDKTEVTNAQFTKCVEAGVCAKTSFDDTSDFDADQQPVVDVDWFDAADYCAWAGGRLPTEAEWEKAARGTDGRTYPWGDETANCDLAVMDDGGGDGCGLGKKAWAVGSKPVGISPYGALDMAGNVFEWVADRYAVDYYGMSPDANPQGPDSGDPRVLRSGSWRNFTNTVRTTSRGWSYPGDWFSFYGFRCVTASTSSP